MAGRRTTRLSLCRLTRSRPESPPRRSAERTEQPRATSFGRPVRCSQRSAHITPTQCNHPKSSTTRMVPATPLGAQRRLNAWGRTTHAESPALSVISVIATPNLGWSTSRPCRHASTSACVVCQAFTRPSNQSDIATDRHCHSARDPNPERCARLPRRRHQPAALGVRFRPPRIPREARRHARRSLARDPNAGDARHSAARRKPRALASPPAWYAGQPEGMPARLDTSAEPSVAHEDFWTPSFGGICAFLTIRHAVCSGLHPETCARPTLRTLLCNWSRPGGTPPAWSCARRVAPCGTVPHGGGTCVPTGCKPRPAAWRAAPGLAAHHATSAGLTGCPRIVTLSEAWRALQAFTQTDCTDYRPRCQNGLDTSE